MAFAQGILFALVPALKAPALQGLNPVGMEVFRAAWGLLRAGHWLVPGLVSFQFTLILGSGHPLGIPAQRRGGLPGTPTFHGP